MENLRNLRVLWQAPVIVAALGYFVDIYDLVLFSIVRVESLTALGLSGRELLDEGVFLLNAQMAGMLIGGIAWGILGDKRGRIAVLFGSIFMYSCANIANAYVESINAYGFWRFIAGFGLAGELGAGITLVAEVLPQKSRGYGTTAVAALGVSGAVFAGLIHEYFSWRTNFLIGGSLGLLLLFMRIGVYESGLFEHSRTQGVKRGHFLSLFLNRNRFARYLQCILIGIPLWYVVGILVTFAPEISTSLAIDELADPGKAIMFCYLGLVFGDLASGLISQMIGSRRKVVAWFLGATGLCVFGLLLTPGMSLPMYYGFCLALGLSCGYWAIFVTIAAEQFGTNLRATVTTTVPNFVRGFVVPLTLSFQAMSQIWGVRIAAGVLGLAVGTLAAIALFFMEESFYKELDYQEGDEQSQSAPQPSLR